MSESEKDRINRLRGEFAQIATRARELNQIRESHGSITIDGPHGTEVYRRLALQQALRLELKGIPLSRGKSAFAIVRAEFGLKGTKAEVYRKFCEICQFRQ